MNERVNQDATGQAKIEPIGETVFGTPRYSVYFDGTGDDDAMVIVCNDCSDRTSLVTLDADAGSMTHHDAWHEENS